MTYKFQRDLNVLLFTASDGSPVDPESVAEVFTRRTARSGLPTLQRPQAHAVVRSRRPALANASNSRHRPFPADGWMLYDMDSVAADGRSLAIVRAVVSRGREARGRPRGLPRRVLAG